jgi:hypothetical protein
MVQTGLLLEKIQKRPVNQWNRERLEENPHCERINGRKHLAENVHSHQQAGHRITVSPDPVQVFLRLRLAHEQHDAGAAIQRSNRHESGFALRFPRILRIRQDKTPEQIDTLERVRELYSRQITLPRSAHASPAGELGAG